MKIGIISDTHGLLRREVFDVFTGVEHIIHAGDVGPSGILTELEAIAPVTAVWGNTDGFDLRKRVREVAHVELGGVPVVVLHGMQLGSPTPEKAAASYGGAGLIVFGHSHRPVIRQVGATLAVNPGSAGPPRFGKAPTLALATLLEGRAEAELLTLDAARM